MPQQMYFSFKKERKKESVSLQTVGLDVFLPSTQMLIWVFGLDKKQM